MAVIATIDEEKRLILSSKRHDLSWFDESEDFRCVVEVKARGLVKLQELKRWADREGLTEEVANATLAQNKLLPMETGTKLSATFLTQAQRRHQSGAVIFEVRMPDLALFALFDQGDGPLKVIRGKAGGIGGKVIISNFGSFAELWGQSIFA